MKLILHIGTHKTGTTSIQRGMASKREELIKVGVWYPNYCDVIGGSKTNYAHLDIAKSLMGEKSRLTKTEARQFLSVLSEKASKMDNINTVVLSAETLLRGKIGSSNKKWTGLQLFQIQLKKLLVGFEDIQVVVTYRNYFDYLESLYNEHVKVTSYSADIFKFYNDFKYRFNYKAITSTWEKNVAPVKVITFDEISGSNITEKWVSLVLGGDVSKIFCEYKVSSNISWPLQMVDLKRLVNFKSQNNSLWLREAIEDYLNTSESDYLSKEKLFWIGPEFDDFFKKTYIENLIWLSENYNPNCIYLADSRVKKCSVYTGIKDRDWISFMINRLEK